MLHEAVSKGQLEDMETLLREEKSKRMALCKDPAGVPLLHKAVYYGHLDVVRWLVQTYPLTVSTKDKVRALLLLNCDSLVLLLFLSLLRFNFIAFAFFFRSSVNLVASCNCNDCHGFPQSVHANSETVTVYFHILRNPSFVNDLTVLRNTGQTLTVAINQSRFLLLFSVISLVRSLLFCPNFIFLPLFVAVLLIVSFIFRSLFLLHPSLLLSVFFPSIISPVLYYFLLCSYSFSVSTSFLCYFPSIFFNAPPFGGRGRTR